MRRDHSGGERRRGVAPEGILRVDHISVLTSYVPSRLLPGHTGIREHEGELQTTPWGGAGGEKRAARDGGGGLQRLPFVVVEESAHRLRRVPRGGIHSYLRVHVQVGRMGLAQDFGPRLSFPSVSLQAA